MRRPPSVNPIGEKAAENGIRGQTRKKAGHSMMVIEEGLLVSGICAPLRFGTDEGEVRGGMVEKTETKS